MRAFGLLVPVVIVVSLWFGFARSMATISFPWHITLMILTPTSSTYTLSAGMYSIKVRYRETGAKLDVRCLHNNRASRLSDQSFTKKSAFGGVSATGRAPFFSLLFESVHAFLSPQLFATHTYSNS